MSIVFDARRKAEQSKRAHQSPPASFAEPAAETHSCEPGDPATANEQSHLDSDVQQVWSPAGGHHRAVQGHTQATRPIAVARSDGTWAPTTDMTTGESTRGAPLVRSLLRSEPSLDGPSQSPPGFDGARIEPATLIWRGDPAYPAIAKQNLISGSVEVRFRISATGKVYGAKTVSGSPLLAQAAVEAVEAWRYEPARLHGTPIDSEASASIDFTLD